MGEGIIIKVNLSYKFQNPRLFNKKRAFSKALHF